MPPRTRTRTRTRQGPPRVNRATESTEEQIREAPARPVATIPEKQPLTLPSLIGVRELSEYLRISPIDVVKELLKSGVVANINQTIDFKTAAGVASNLGYPVSESPTQDRRTEGTSARRFQGESEADLRLRPPVVTVMGHVDHGKTSLLDAIRETNVTEREAGGITQHIGAYQVEIDHQKITFLDTPGHEAFTAMRARGAQATDIAIIVVAADDGVMPQTIEAIDHARAAGVPIIVAINKIDRPDADQERVKRQLAEQNLLIEEWGGNTVCVSVSARTREGLPNLLEHILLVAELEELKANPDRHGEGVVVEALLDQQRGPLATLLVQTGTLRVGDVLVAEETYGHIKALYDERGHQVKRAEPATPVKAMGLNSVPPAGAVFTVVPDDRTARTLVEQRQRGRLAAEIQHPRAVTLHSFHDSVQAGQSKELNLVLKADVQGSLEPIRVSLLKLGGDNLRVRVLRAASGNITESDVMLALASNGIVLGFNTRPEPGARRLADSEGVEIRIYEVIYTLIEDIEKALEGMLEPTIVEVIDGHAEVRQIFRLSRTTTVVGCSVTDGKATRSSLVRVLRRGRLMGEDKVASLKRFKEDVREVATGFECGIGLENFTEFEEGDVIELYRRERSS